MGMDEELRALQLETEEREKTMRIKAAKQDISAYCMMWGNEDTKDLSGEYFTPQTDVGNIDREIPLRYYSGGDFVELGTAKLAKDSVGIYAVGHIEPDLHNPQQSRYAEAVVSMLNQKQLLFSMSTQAGFEDTLKRNENYVDENGEIRYWPIIGVLVTPTPSDPR